MFTCCCCCFLSPLPSPRPSSLAAPQSGQPDGLMTSRPPAGSSTQPNAPAAKHLTKCGPSLREWWPVPSWPSQLPANLLPSSFDRKLSPAGWLSAAHTGRLQMEMTSRRGARKRRADSDGRAKRGHSSSSRGSCYSEAASWTLAAPLEERERANASERREPEVILRFETRPIRDGRQGRPAIIRLPWEATRRPSSAGGL